MANAHLEAGRIADAVRLAELITEASVLFGDRDGQAWGDLVLGRARMLRGDIAGAQAVLREAAVLFTDLDFAAQLRWARGSLAMAAGFAGDADGAAAACAQLDLVESGWGFMEADMLRAQAWAVASSGDLAAARSRLLDAYALASETGHHTIGARALHDLVRLGVARGRVEALDALGAQLDGPMPPLLVRHRQALAAADADALLGVAAGFAGLELGTYAAEAAYQASAQLGREGSRRAAAAAAQRAASYLPVGSTLRTPAVLAAGRGVNPLTQRERDVATLAAEGLSSKEVAAKLSVSLRTVDNLLQRAYRKLGVTSRRELRDRLR
jgi:DNA-binding CsgD family transcriptional regulator